MHAKPESHDHAAAIRVRIDGAVQGVGFRPWVWTLAHRSGIRGRVWNDAASVRIEAFGPSLALERFVNDLSNPPMLAARVLALASESITDLEHLVSEDGFEIVESTQGTERHPAIPPDLALCDDCRREIWNPRERRHGYPFTNCTRCGPRYTICTQAPYDRSRTTMNDFAMCPDCQQEYDDPHDRRFHAQPIACPVCGPQLHLVVRDGTRVDTQHPLQLAVGLLREGRIVAIKGLGGYHLACDARCESAVRTLRERKHREARPFAIMVADLPMADQLARLNPVDRALLISPARPVVLVGRRPQVALAESLSPKNPLLGIMLPYTPLHELLLASFAGPLVMTSANHSNEPMVTDDQQALRTLMPSLADAVLTHDRVIANRADDSVVQSQGEGTLVLRRGRGLVPARTQLPHRSPRPLLACGAELKNSFCLAVGDAAWLGPHVGDLETHEACNEFENMVSRFEQFCDVRPQVVAHDLNPRYFTTGWAERGSFKTRIGIQHHHAHIASAMVEHDRSLPVLGLAWDGTGFGTDGTAWGGEFLLADLAGYRRVATFRPVSLAGGDVAIREVWRIALAALDDAFEGDPPLHALRPFDSLSTQRIALVRRMLASGVNTTQARGVGRWFDVAGALILGLTDSCHEGEVAMRLGFAASPNETRAYSVDVCGVLSATSGAPLLIDLRPTLRDLVDDLINQASPAACAARFQNTLIEAGGRTVEAIEREHGRHPVVLTGGCFQNPRLVEGLTAALQEGREVLVHGEVPPNDGGIALGQAAIAAAVLAESPCALGPGAERPCRTEVS